MSDGVSRGNIFKRLANKLKRKFKRWQSEPTTSDWRSLSPNQPPLPFLTPEYRLRDSVNDKKLREERSVLFPILEESEIMTEEVIQAPFDDSNLPSTPDSNLPSNIDSNLPSNIDSNIENLPSNTQFICSNDTTPLDDKSNVPPTTSSQTPSDITLDSQPSSDHSQPHSWHYTPSDKYFSDTLIGDELLCKKKFAKMIVKLMTNTHDNRPSHMDLTFDEDGNIDNVHIIRNYRSEYHKFCGYIPL
ncbi:hypothetical protein BDB01DRAFT_425004 [Pilobolus umbonatus]|nr:hypothetical protein BDB01DRAFT_425004 [Pilobolus umbonatus]